MPLPFFELPLHYGFHICLFQGRVRKVMEIGINVRQDMRGVQSPLPHLHSVKEIHKFALLFV
jgi:hypothetical protein